MKPTIIETPVKTLLFLTILNLFLLASFSLLHSTLWPIFLGSTVSFLFMTLYLHNYFIKRSISHNPPYTRPKVNR